MNLATHSILWPKYREEPPWSTRVPVGYRVASPKTVDRPLTEETVPRYVIVRLDAPFVPTRFQGWTHTSDERVALPVVYDESAASLLADEERRAATEKIATLLATELAGDSVAVQRIEVTGFEDVEEETSQVVLTVKTTAPPAEAMALWDRASAIVEQWSKSQPEPVRDVVRDQIAVSVRW